MFKEQEGVVQRAALTRLDEAVLERKRIGVGNSAEVDKPNRFHSERLSPGETGIDGVPESNALFAALPTEQHQLAFAIMRKIDQPLVKVFEFATQLAEEFQPGIDASHNLRVLTCRFAPAIAAGVFQRRLNRWTPARQFIARGQHVVQALGNFRNQRIRFSERKSFHR